MRDWIRRFFATPKAYRTLLEHCKAVERAVKVLHDENEQMKRNAQRNDEMMVQVLATASAAEAHAQVVEETRDKAVAEAIRVFNATPGTKRMNVADRIAITNAIAGIATGEGEAA